MITARTDRLVWGTGWPHPGMGPRAPETIQPFVLQKILVDNPARLYDFREEA